MVYYGEFTKKLKLPPGFVAPRELTWEDVVARAMTRDDLQEDVRGINASMELIRSTRGGNWPTEPVTEDFNYVDLVWHECEFRDGTSFTYVLRAEGRGYIGNAYLYPMGRRQELTEELATYDVDASWWVTPDAHADGYYEKVYAALQRWTVEDFPFTRVHYSNKVIPGAAPP
jgi:hypothetical protein